MWACRHAGTHAWLRAKRHPGQPAKAARTAASHTASPRGRRRASRPGLRFGARGAGPNRRASVARRCVRQSGFPLPQSLSESDCASVHPPKYSTIAPLFPQLQLRPSRLRPTRHCPRPPSSTKSGQRGCVACSGRRPVPGTSSSPPTLTLPALECPAHSRGMGRDEWGLPRYWEPKAIAPSDSPTSHRRCTTKPLPDLSACDLAHTHTQAHTSEMGQHDFL